MNRVELIGRLTKDPELRYIPGSGTAVATFTLAVNRDFLKKDGTRDADFIRVEIMGKRGEAVANWLTKGKLVAVSGALRIDNYQDKDGTYKSYTKVSADQVEFLEKNNKNDNVGGTPEQSSYPSVEDSDIPF